MNCQFAICLDRDAGLDLEHNVNALKNYSLEAWLRCGIIDGGSPDAGR